MFVTNPVQSAASQVIATNDIRDIRPPVEIASIWVLVAWILGALVVGALFTALVIYLIRRSKRAPVPPPLPPAHVRARQKLQEALALISQPKPFCILVSDTIRLYLEERFDFHAPERTTEEFLYELQGTDLLSRDQKESLGGFLESCDLVKFAKYEPGEPELRDLHGSALRLIEETEPQPVPQGPPPLNPAQLATTASGGDSKPQPEMVDSR